MQINRKCASCPGQPCLTLSQYSKAADHYFHSNTVFKFLSGTHHVDRPVKIQNIQNVSLEWLQDQKRNFPHLMAQFHDNEVCNGTNNYCSVLWFHNVVDVALSGLTISVHTPYISGIVLWNSSNIDIQLTETDSEFNTTTQAGIFIYECISVRINSSNVYNFVYGFVFKIVANCNISNITAAHNSWKGIHLEEMNKTRISNAMLMHNGGVGMFFQDMLDTNITNITAVANNIHGINVRNMSYTEIVNITAASNGHSGILFSIINNANISIVNATKNLRNGIDIRKMNNTQLNNITAMHNTWSGILLRTVNNFYITTAYVVNNSQNGMDLANLTTFQVTNANILQNGMFGMLIDTANTICIANSTAARNKFDGLSLFNLNQTQLSNINTTLNGKNGLSLQGMIESNISNIRTMYNKLDGMYLQNLNETAIANTVTTNNGRVGLVIKLMNDTFITNTTATNNIENGLYLQNNNNTQALNTNTTYNGLDGMSLLEMHKTCINKTTAMYNSHNGMAIENATNIYINVTKTTNNGKVGMLLRGINNSNITDTTSKHNGYDGVSMETMTSISMADTVAAHNTMHGISLNKTSNASIFNAILKHNRWTGMTLRIVNNTQITNLYIAENFHSGITVIMANYTIFTNVTSILNDASGLTLILTHDTFINRAFVQCNNGYTMFGPEYALHLGLFYQINGQIFMSSSADTTIYNSTFEDVNPSIILSTTTPNDLPSIITLYQSALNISECAFIRNYISALRAHASNITLSGDILFSNNTAISGTAFVLVQGSRLKLVENSDIVFKNNYATNTGGVFYLGDSALLYLGDVFLKRTCFLDTSSGRSQINLTFTNNSAGLGGDILYGGQVAFGLDSNWNCLESFKNISTITETGLSLISSDPSRICLCNEIGVPNCLILSDLTTHTTYPGQPIFISAVVVGQDFGTVAGSVHAQYLKRVGTDNQLNLFPTEMIQSVTQKSCSTLKYTVFSPNGTCKQLVLVLTTQNSIVSGQTANNFFPSTKSYLEQFYNASPKTTEAMLLSYNPVFVNIYLLPCPLGFVLTNDPPYRCDCIQLLKQMPGVKCYIQEQTISRSGLVWVGVPDYGEHNESSETVAASKYCPTNYCNRRESSIKLHRDDSQCNYNHSGTLCGGCQPGLSLALGSAQCLLCSNKYLALLIPFALAGPVLVGFIKSLDLTISQGTLNGLIFYANVIQANRYIFLPWTQNNPLSVFIAWLNLDLGMETCFFQGLDAYYKTWLQFVFPLYVWSIAGFIIVLAKYSNRVATVMGNNSVPVLATLFVLSHAKLFRIIITSLSYTILHTSQGNKAVWSADGNVDYLRQKHAPLFAAALASLLFLWLPYTLILFLGQWLQRCNYRPITRMLFRLKPFLDAHYGPLKDKHRYWFGALHLMKAATLLISALIPADHSSIVIFSILVSAALLLCMDSIVYQNQVVSIFDMTLFLNLMLFAGTKFFTQITGGNFILAAYTLIGMSFLQFAAIVVSKIYSILKNCPKVKALVGVRQPIEDELVLLEQREIESSSSSEEDSDDTGSNENLPTY